MSIVRSTTITLTIVGRSLANGDVMNLNFLMFIVVFVYLFHKIKFNSSINIFL